MQKLPSFQFICWLHIAPQTNSNMQAHVETMQLTQNNGQFNKLIYTTLNLPSFQFICWLHPLPI